MTNEELERLFSVFGQVTHVCIMAVLDNLGRRRAFVDMATGESARQAINSFSGTIVQGYKMDLSFAIVQRSGGPVSGPLVSLPYFPRLRVPVCDPLPLSVPVTTLPPDLVAILRAYTLHDYPSFPPYLSNLFASRHDFGL